MKKKTRPLVSVVIPAYNIEDFIAECVESVQNQTYQNLEIILVDDGSTDGTAAYCEKAAAADGRITVIHQENGGVVAARNAGLRVSHGKYLSFVDGDDYLEPNMFEILLDEIGTSDMASAGVYQERLPDDVVECRDGFPPGLYEGKEALSLIYGKMIYDQETGRLQPMTSWIHNKLYIRSTAERIHEGLDRELIFAEDSVFLYRYMLECKSFVISDRCLYHYRYRKGSAVHCVNENMLADINRVYLALTDVFREHWMSKELLFQLQKWVMEKACIAVNETMGFDERIHIPEFTVDTEGLDGRKVVLYGAGRVGRDACWQLKRSGREIVLWADKSYRHYQGEGLSVQAPDEILQTDYDVVLIAVEDERVAKEIQKSLTGKGIPEEAILWHQPVKLY